MFMSFLRGVTRTSSRARNIKLRSGFAACSLTRAMKLEQLEDRRVLAAIHGQKWHDVDADGQQDADEPGLNGWTIELRDTKGEVLATAITTDMDADSSGDIDPITESGLFWFRDLPDGTYVVTEVRQSDWIQSNIDSTVATAWELDQAFGFFIDGDNEWFNWQGSNEKWP